jgi:glycosyltransferase
VDGGSSDQTVELVLSNYHDKMRLFKIKDDGIYAGFNNALRKPVGEYIIFLNADDYFYSESILNTVYDVAKTENSDVIYGDLLISDDNGKIIRNWISGKFELCKLRRGWAPPHPSFFFRKNSFDHFFREDLKISSDYDFMLRCLTTKGKNVSYLNSVVTVMVAGGISSRSIKSRLRCMVEDYVVLKSLGMGGFLTMLLKRLRKITQFMKVQK